ncbi:MAG: glutamate synthase [Chloroflexota bacterium]
MTAQREIAEKLIASRSSLVADSGARPSSRKSEAEGGCGVIGIACSEQVPARHLLESLRQMRNRGNGKGGGVAAVGLVPEELGVTKQVLETDYLIALAYLDPAARPGVERDYIEPTFLVDRVHHVSTVPDVLMSRSCPDVPELNSGTSGTSGRLEIQPPDVYLYFVRVKPNVIEEFKKRNGLDAGPGIEGEIVYQNSYRLNHAFYASIGEKRAFVLSHGKNMLVLKMVGYGDDVIRYYQLEDWHAHVWIGHHRYPTKGRVWHPGGAHPFVGLHEALVHNGDFANYASICEYLAQRNIYPQFLTDTEVSVLVFDLLHRIYGYPLEYVIESLAPTTERDFTLLPQDKQNIYQMLQTTHMHGSPDGPWFFLIAQSQLTPLTQGGPRPPLAPPSARGLRLTPSARGQRGAYRLIGITDTSMLRPQVFALQQGAASIGFAASEKQAIDAALESLALEDPRFWTRADLYWNARGGSHTDGGAFIFTIEPHGNGAALVCTDKFGKQISVNEERRPYESIHRGERRARGDPSFVSALVPELHSGTVEEIFKRVVKELPGWSYEDVNSFLSDLERSAQADVPEFNSGTSGRARAIQALTLLMDRRYSTGQLRPSSLLSLFDRSFGAIVEQIRESPSSEYVFVSSEGPRPSCRVVPELHSAAPHLASPLWGEGQGEGLHSGTSGIGQTVVIDARGFASEGEHSLALEIVRLYKRGFRRFLVAHAKGHRFIANGLGPNSHGVRIDVYGSSGDYLASGIDGAEVFVHGNAQDQLAQIMKDGRLVVYGDVGQTFMYAAKGGRAFVLGNAAGRPLINAVGRPRVVINGTCLDYLAESFMAGDPLNGGGFVILNGIAFDDDGQIIELDTPYPGGNLFSLASGGAIYIRDPYRKVSEAQLNGGEFADLGERDWALINPYLEENERLFGIPLARLLEVSGVILSPHQVYRKIRPRAIRALQAEEAWVKMHM